MSTVRVYGQSACAASDAARAYINSQGFEVEFVDPCVQPPTLEVLERAVRCGAMCELVNRERLNGSSDDFNGLSHHEQAEVLLQNPAALQAPIVVRGGYVQVGSDPARLSTLLY